METSDALETTRGELIELLKVFPPYKLAEAKELLEGLIADDEGVFSHATLKALNDYATGRSRILPKEELKEYLRKRRAEREAETRKAATGG